MANICEVTPEMESEWLEWANTRPSEVREVALRFRPWILYQMIPTGQRVYIVSLAEMEDDSVTLSVMVSGDFNQVMFERKVFGVNPDDLEECDLPGLDEKVGAVLTSDEDIKKYIDKIRPGIMAQRNRDNN